MTLLLLALPVVSVEAETDSEAVPYLFLSVLVDAGDNSADALAVIEKEWHPGFVPMVLEVLRLSRDSQTVVSLVSLLQAKTGQPYGFDLDGWYRWLWNEDEVRHPEYARFKSLLYTLIDPRFGKYFGKHRPAKIRLDEIVWGGVVQDGIPPLRNPEMIKASDADYLDNDNIVFGIEVNGDARAYPKRIMGWHEMFVDDVGGLPVVGVYCTLCGTMILYKTELRGVNHRLGTSGFLYRSNKLMYDGDTNSLWNTLWGMPVVGPLAGDDVQLERLSIVTTTWGAWRQRHPDTQVLSLNTGHRRDYSEGAAYREYFATDELMFTVPALDTRLKNKDEVLGLVFARYPAQPLAIAVEYLSENPVYHDRVGDLQFVVLTDVSGASRVYESPDVRFSSWDGNSMAVDADGNVWKLTESALEAGDGRVLYRLPAHRAFWFGWYSAYSHTRLIAGR
jgi:hypothetical protein